MFEYKVRIEQFEGPLDLLLQLIEKDELDINEVSLARVADDYLSHVNSSENILPEELADFLVIAAKLILLKSKQLMPNLVLEEEEGIDLETQLKMYREFVEVSRKMNAMIKKRRWSYSREKTPLTDIQGFFPPQDLETGDIKKAFDKVLHALEPFVALPKEAVRKTVSITEKIEHIRKLISSQVSTRFSEVMNQAKDRTEVIVSFLALLELIKQRIVNTSQDKLFEDITIEKSEV